MFLLKHRHVILSILAYDTVIYNKYIFGLFLAQNPQPSLESSQ